LVYEQQCSHRQRLRSNYLRWLELDRAVNVVVDALIGNLVVPPVGTAYLQPSPYVHPLQ
jgi:hypothetical protein